MNLIPFNSELAPKILKFYYDAEYAPFCREIGRWITFEEVAYLPKLLDQEILFLMDDYCIDPLGIISLKEMPRDVIYFSYAIDKSRHQEGIGRKTLYLIEDYIFTVKNARLAITEVLSDNVRLIDALVRENYIVAGHLPNYNRVNGKLKGVSILYKEKSTWGSSTK